MAWLRNFIFKVLNTVNYFYRAVSIFQHPGKEVLTPALEVDFTEPEKLFLKRCAGSFNFEIDYSGGYRQKEISVTRLSSATLLGNSGALVLGGKIVTESAFDMRRLALSPAWRMPAFMLPKNKTGLYTSVFHQPWAATSNYHWFFDCLPRVYALAHFLKEPITLVMPEGAPAFQRETMEFVLKDFQNFRIEYIGSQEKWECADFIFPSFVAGHVSGYLPPVVSGFLRDKIFTGYSVEPKSPERKIYISRSRSAKRRITNEAELLPILARFGFEVVFPEELSYRQQVQLFSETRVIVGAHGAGFTNTFFCQNATILELHPETAIKPHYFLLCKGLDLEYHYLIGSQSDEKLDFTVPKEAFEEKLKEIMA